MCMCGEAGRHLWAKKWRTSRLLPVLHVAHCSRRCLPMLCWKLGGATQPAHAPHRPGCRQDCRRQRGRFRVPTPGQTVHAAGQAAPCHAAPPCMGVAHAQGNAPQGVIGTAAQPARWQVRQHAGQIRKSCPPGRPRPAPAARQLARRAVALQCSRGPQQPGGAATPKPVTAGARQAHIYMRVCPRAIFWPRWGVMTAQAGGSHGPGGRTAAKRGQK